MSEKLLATGSDLIERFEAAGLTARLLGGVGIALVSPSARTKSALMRSFSDLDLVVDRNTVRRIDRVMSEADFLADERFNVAHGRSRQIFYQPASTLHIDVFVERFKMCHELDLRKRLGVSTPTLPLADLLLTKAQVAELNRKDLTDLVALLLDHPLGSDDTGICVPYICEVLSGDWGWWRTVRANLTMVDGLLGDVGLADAERATVAAQLTQLTTAIDQAPKSRRWKLRARVGDRMPWREDPEEAGVGEP